MSRSDPPIASTSRPPLDWRGWLALTWALWFGLLYGQMILAQRDGKLRSLLRPAAAPARPQRSS
jgi:hypothetical protein